MGIATNNRMSGFRKWAEAHQPAKLDYARNERGVDMAADDLLGGKTPDRQRHRPWLVPGMGKL